MAITEGGPGGATVKRAGITNASQSFVKEQAARRATPNLSQIMSVTQNQSLPLQQRLAAGQPGGVISAPDPYAGMTNQQMNAIRSGGAGPSLVGAGAVQTPQGGLLPAQTLQAPQPQQGPDLGGLRQLGEQELAAAMAAIEAQYGLTREQLLADQSEAGSTYRFLMSNLDRARQAAVEGATGEAIGRGVLRSGIQTENISEIERGHAERAAQAEADKGARLNQINQQLAALQAQQAAAQAGTAAQIGGRQLATEQQLAQLRQLAPQGY